MHAFIISDVLPDIRFTGGQVLFKMLNNLPDIDFSIVWINQWQLDYPKANEFPKNSKVISSFDFEPTEFTKKVQRSIDRLSSIKILLPIGLAFRGLMYYIRLLGISLKIIILIRLRRPDFIWLVLQGDKLAIIFSIIRFFNKDKVILLHQWDPITWWLKGSNRPQWFIGLMGSVVASLEKKAQLNIVPSKAWANKLILEKKNAHPVDNFFEDASFSYPYINYHRPKILNAVFIGQLYANDELTTICRDLLAFGERYKIEVILHYFGPNKVTELANIKVISHGFINPRQLTEEICIYDLALLPYPVAPDYAETAKLSFPSKCRQYLQSGLPILALAPIESGVHEFLVQSMPHQAYFNVQSDPQSNPNEFLDSIATLSYEEKKQLHLNVRHVGAKYFSASAEMLPFEKKLNELVYP